MSDIQILMWAMGGGFLGTWVIIGIGFKILYGDLKSLREEIRDIDRRLCRIEGAMSNKDCCMLKHDQIGIAK